MEEEVSEDLHQEQVRNEDLCWEQGGESNQTYPTAEVAIKGHCGGVGTLNHARWVQRRPQRATPLISSLGGDQQHLLFTERLL